MTKVSKWYQKQREAKTKVVSKSVRKREEEIERACSRARARRKDPEERKKATQAFKESYFKTLRPENSSKHYPSLDENKYDPQATAVRGIDALRVKLNSMDPETRKREEAAIEEADRRGKSMAPICNKGGYQLITKDSLHTIGRKV